MGAPAQPINGSIPIQPQYVIQALQEENYHLREQNVTLRGILFQTRAEAQEQISALQSQVKSYRDAEVAKPISTISTDELFGAAAEGK